MRYAFRTLRRSPGFTLAATLALALGIGSTTAIFTVVHSVLLRPLAFPDSDRLVWIWGTSPRAAQAWLHGADLVEFQRYNRSFEGLAGYYLGSWNLSGVGEPKRLLGARMTREFFDLLGLRPHLGRMFTAAEYVVSRQGVVMFSHGFWQREFGGDASVVGRAVTIDGDRYEVVGILPPAFRFPADCELFAPLALNTPLLTERRYRLLRAFGRLKPGVSIGQAQADLAAIARRLEEQFPKENGGSSVRVLSLREHEVGSARATLWMFALAVALVLLIACANVANLMLARAASREREIAVRSAMGASRRRLLGQLLGESALLSLLGAAAGIPLAVWGVRLLVKLDPSALPRMAEIRVDAVALAFTLLLALLTGLAFGMVPALRSSLVHLQSALKEGGRGSTAGPRRNRYRSALVVSEVALGVMLLVGAGLLARSLDRLVNVPTGFDPSGVLTAQIALSDIRYSEPRRRLDFFERLIQRIGALPGVEAAGSVNMIPLGGQENTASFWFPSDPGTRFTSSNRIVTPDYFRALRIPLLAGRFFTWNDRQGAPKAILVNDAFARGFFPAGDATGRTLTLDLGYPWTGEIVGVVGSVRQSRLDQEPQRELYTMLLQTPMASQTVVVRASGDPALLAPVIRRQIAAVDKDIPTFNVRTMPEVVATSLSQARLRSTLLGAFSLIALLLASVGVYGVISCAAAERRHEIGVRVALGARPGQILRMVVGYGLALTGMGLGVGLTGAALLARLLRRFLYGVTETDPLTFAAAAGAFVLVALAASWLPAHRTTRVDPLVALRDE